MRAIGAGVTSVAVGDRVATTMMYGAFAERVVAPEIAVVKLPDAVSFEIGAATLLTYATTYYALVDRASIKAGDSLLVLGAAGGVGIAAVELGALLGARVIAAASSEDKLAFCRAHGASEGICYGREDLACCVERRRQGADRRHRRRHLLRPRRAARSAEPALRLDGVARPLSRRRVRVGRHPEDPADQPRAAQWWPDRFQACSGARSRCASRRRIARTPSSCSRGSPTARSSRYIDAASVAVC